MRFPRKLLQGRRSDADGRGAFLHEPTVLFLPVGLRAWDSWRGPQNAGVTGGYFSIMEFLVASNPVGWGPVEGVNINMINSMGPLYRLASLIICPMYR